MNVYLLGAGASKAYEESKTKVKLPLANDFFNTFNNLDISTNGWVLIGDLLNYVSDKKGISVLEFSSYKEDIEVLHSEIQEDYLNAIKKGDNPEIIKYSKAYSQLVFLFCSVINEIQNGEESEFHKNLVLGLNNDDSIITFNWDTLIDKSLRNNTCWIPEDGYYLKPNMVYRDKWGRMNKKGSNNFLLKLHGSTNWISSYIQYNFQSKKIDFHHEGAEDLLYIYESTKKPYACYDGRFMSGYEDFSMGYYPPNIPHKEYKQEILKDHIGFQITPRSGINPKGKSSSQGMVSMPIIIPPVKNKSYDFYGNLFPTLWKKAEDVLAEADTIYILGYSFPVTDLPSIDLFKKAFNRRNTIPNIVIINPYPEEIAHKFMFEFGIPKNKLKVYSEYITSDYVLPT